MALRKIAQWGFFKYQRFVTKRVVTQRGSAISSERSAFLCKYPQTELDNFRTSTPTYTTATHTRVVVMSHVMLTVISRTDISIG